MQNKANFMRNEPLKNNKVEDKITAKKRYCAFRHNTSPRKLQLIEEK